MGNLMHLKEIANIIKERRKTLGIAQSHLAELSGVGLRTLKAIETGKNNPTLGTIVKLAEVLGMEFKLEIKKPKL